VRPTEATRRLTIAAPDALLNRFRAFVTGLCLVTLRFRSESSELTCEFPKSCLSEVSIGGLWCGITRIEHLVCKENLGKGFAPYFAQPPEYLGGSTAHPNSTRNWLDLSCAASGFFDGDNICLNAR